MKQYFAIALFALMGLTASAQSTDASEESNSTTKIEERIEKIKSELSLTMDQEAKLREVMKVQMEDMRTEKKKMREAEKAMKEINKKYHESLASFLSEDQITLLKGMKPSSEEREGHDQNKGSKKGQK